MVREGQRGGSGRKKTDTSKLIPDLKARQFALSKRRNTLFRMAGVLATITGAQVAVVVVLPASARGKEYAFGSPSVDAVLQRLPSSSAGNAAALPVAEEDDAARVSALRQELEDIKGLVTAEGARIKAVEAGVKRAKVAAGTNKWWEADVSKLGAAELPDFEAALRQIRDAAQRQAAEKNGTATRF
uniref:Uncharacterized protein n=1 Tax=Avena sativa TaxID=4498 RepID=A0ACD5XAM6_AVESA